MRTISAVTITTTALGIAPSLTRIGARFGGEKRNLLPPVTEPTPSGSPGDTWSARERAGRPREARGPEPTSERPAHTTLRRRSRGAPRTVPLDAGRRSRPSAGDI